MSSTNVEHNHRVVRQRFTKLKFLLSDPKLNPYVSISEQTWTLIICAEREHTKPQAIFCFLWIAQILNHVHPNAALLSAILFLI